MEKSNKGYYDFDIDDINVEQVLVEQGLIYDLFYLKDLKQRKLYLNSEIDQSSIADIVKHILQFNKEDAGIPAEERQPVLLYVVSNGGEVDAGFELIDTIIASKTPVYTINLGNQYSMGFLIGIAGHKRFASKNAKFLMHDGSQFIYDSGTKAQDRMEFQKQVEEHVKDYILSRSSLTSEEYDGKLRVEWYMYAAEAKDKGFVDYIIGEDCDIEQVI